ncbi:MAG: DNA-directed RNA polymerase subunit alpha [Candidatus Latescibacterota bacterium]|nr:MAG: DNA-directed RNA polymerase subunit alpha [Candidatus Latescibacterota bacterium]RKY72939.1 MAG: DNA-directed RNA polymerase subunit alpha [Candidatus Latescibacterota bacterium]
MKKDFYMPRRVEIDQSTLTDDYGKFIVQPLERGFGVTLGNALRRVLLSSIKGTAIQSIRIDGVYHEFSTIPGVVEDVTEIVLNLKEVCFKLHDSDSKKITVDRQGSCELRAKDLEVDPSIEVLNPDLHLATLGEDAHFRAEIVLGTGRGYVPCEENKLSDRPIGTIAIDCVFSPVRKVNYKVENTRVEQKTDYEKLTLEVWTNKVVSPQDAVSAAARILRDHLKLFVDFKEQPQEAGEEIDREKIRLRKLLQMPVDELELSMRSSNCLRAAEIKTLGDLVQKTESEMLKYRNFGKKSLSELQNVLAKFGLSFGMNLAELGIEKEEETDATS